MALYETERRKKSYSFGEGKFNIEKRDTSKLKAEEVINKEKSDSPLEKAKLVKMKDKEEAKGPKLVEEEEEKPFLKKEEFGPKQEPVKEEEPVEEEKEPVSNEVTFDKTLNDLGIPVNNYTGTTNKDKIYHIDGKPVDYQTSEVSSGGKIDPNLNNVAKEVFPGLKGVPGMKVTGGNDAYHLSDEYYSKKYKKRKGIKGDLSEDQLKAARKLYKQYPSKHTNGRSMDFVVKNDANTLKNTREHFLSLGLNYDDKTGEYSNDKYKILDEYSHPSSGSSSPHFHVEVFKDGKWQTSDGHKD